MSEQHKGVRVIKGCPEGVHTCNKCGTVPYVSVPDLAELFHELREYLDARADVADDESGEDGPSVSPNEAMILLGKVDKALESLEVK